MNQRDFMLLQKNGDSLNTVFQSTCIKGESNCLNKGTHCCAGAKGGYGGESLA